MALAVQTSERVEVRVDLREKSAEVSEPGRQAGHRLGAARPKLSFEIRDERRPQVQLAVRQPRLEALGLLGRLGWHLDDV